LRKFLQRIFNSGAELSGVGLSPDIKTAEQVVKRMCPIGQHIDLCFPAVRRYVPHDQAGINLVGQPLGENLSLKSV
jgi:hypothetical protein